MLGRNGSGKQHIDQLLLGKLSGYTAQSVDLGAHPERIRLVSFEAQQVVYERELQLAANDMLEGDDAATSARAFLPTDQLQHPLIDRLAFRHRLDTHYTQLSTGESRKLLVLQAILEGAETLVLDNPFDSLDVVACELLSSALASLSENGITVLMLLSNRQDVPPWCEHLALIDDGQLTLFEDATAPSTQAEVDQLLSPRDDAQPDWPQDALTLTEYPHEQLIDLQHCSVYYGGKAVLDKLDLTVAPLQHTLITGENGSGKSTLLGLITGDCTQCYSNDVTVLGHRRGSGESVWDLKAHMGIVSNDLHRRYRVRCSALTVVCSGFFDSIGLYDAAGDHEKTIARQWLAAAGLEGHEDASFHEMSYGEQRLVLIARALVKSPLLLILDEPTQGLDEPNRAKVMNLLETLNRRRHSTVLFVSHRIDEQLDLFKQHIHLSRNQ